MHNSTLKSLKFIKQISFIVFFVLLSINFFIGQIFSALDIEGSVELSEFVNTYYPVESSLTLNITAYSFEGDFSNALGNGDLLERIVRQNFDS